MKLEKFVKQRVNQYYWTDDINCATTTLKILCEKFNIEINPQVIDATIGMHGAGEYGAQCGLVEGTLMFIGIYGRKHNIALEKIVLLCNKFASQYESKFKSLQCSVLRPEGFNKNNPPHICEPLTCNAVEFAINFIEQIH